MNSIYKSVLCQQKNPRKADNRPGCKGSAIAPPRGSRWIQLLTVADLFLREHYARRGSRTLHCIPPHVDCGHYCRGGTFFRQVGRGFAVVTTGTLRTQLLTWANAQQRSRAGKLSPTSPWAQHAAAALRAVRHLCEIGGQR